jgi:hypothetical protein
MNLHFLFQMFERGNPGYRVFPGPALVLADFNLIQKTLLSFTGFGECIDRVHLNLVMRSTDQEDKS